MAKEKKPKKVVFSEEIDSRIDGLTLGFAFVIRWIFIGIGALGLFVEFGKLKPISNIKGFDVLWVGVLFLAGWAALFFLTQHWIWNILGFILLIIGVYGAFLGLFRIVYSIRLNRKERTQTKATIISDIIMFLTKVASLALQTNALGIAQSQGHCLSV
mgnify:CR=1 FL=1